MKKILILCVVVLIAAGAFIWRVVAKPSLFGHFNGAAQVEVSALVEHPKDYVGRPLSAEGTVTEQCQAMGCYFMLRDARKALRVDLQDIAMTAPMHEGKPVRVEGQLLPYGEGYQLVATAVEFR